MNHLSGMDASFLHLETPETPMHVGGMHTLELPAGYKGDFYEDFKQHIANRLHISDVFTRKLALMPFELSNPVWVEDDEVDIDYHIRRVTLPKPGTHKQLEQYVARLHSSLLDRSRPLWEFFVIDGLEKGRVALYTKVHHAGIDGQAGVALATAIMDVTPEPRAVRPPRQQRRTPRSREFGVELARELWSPLDGGDEPDVMHGPRGRPPGGGGIEIERVGKIGVAAADHPRSGRGLDQIPAELGRPRRRRKALHRTGEHTQPGHAGRFFARMREQLETEADGEDRPAGGKPLGERVREPAFGQLLHDVPECADAR